MKLTTKLPLLFLAAAAVVFGQQNTLSYTTLSAATDNQQAYVTLAATPTYSFPFLIYIDTEAMLATGNPSGSTFTVSRGWDGTKARAHNASVFAFYGPLTFFSDNDKNGQCVAANELVLPIINVRNGNLFNCNSSGSWFISNIGVTPEDVSFPRTALSDTAYLARITDSFITYTALTAARSLTLPIASLFPVGKELLVKDESGAAATYNITIVPTSGTIDGAANKVVNANYGKACVYSSGSAWFTCQ